MALKEANGMQAARAKVGAFGGTGSGKTTTLSLLAAGVSKEFHQGAPIAFYSTEPGVDFVKPIFEVEGIKLYEDRSKSFKDLLDAVKQAQQLQCCVLIVDSITHVWRELVDAYCAKRNISKPEFHHWKDIKAEWGKWTDLYVNAPIHIFVAGRAGNEYEYEVDERGKKELVKGDSKMKAEGEFGYEADLLIEMFSDADASMQRAVRKKNAPRTHESRMSHTALIRKSRVWSLNGQQFQFPDEDGYKLNGYQAVFNAMLPYFQALNLKSQHVGIDTSRNSESMISEDQGGEWRQAKIRKEVVLEDIEGTMLLLLPGQDAKSKQYRLMILEQVFGHRGWTAVQNLNPMRLQDGRDVLREFEVLVKQNNGINGDEELAELVKNAKFIVEEHQLALAESPI
jgi:AAA domain